MALTLERGTVRIIRSDDKYHEFNLLTTCRVNERQAIKSNFDNRAVKIAWNLEEGDYVTFFDNTSTIENNNENVHKSLTFDCVGTGKTEIANMPSKVKECLSGYVWRKYNRDWGYVELFYDPDFKGNSVKIFLSEFAVDTFHSMSSWWFDNTAASLKWDKLGETCTFAFYENSDGTGKRIDFLMGSQQQGNLLKDKALKNFDFLNMHNSISCFKWSKREPKKQSMEVVKIDFDASQVKTVSVGNTAGIVKGKNNSDDTHEYVLTAGQNVNMTNSVTFNRDVSVDVTAGFTVSYEPDKGYGGSISMAYNHGEKWSSGGGSSASNSINLSSTKTITIPERCLFTIDWKLEISSLPATPFTAKLTSWYDFQVRGSQYDPTCGWYKRDELIKGEFKGDFSYQTVLNTSYEPLK